MTGQRAKELIPILTAIADGKEIQCLRQIGGAWEHVDGLPNTAWAYRVKPEPREGWVVIHTNHQGWAPFYSNPISAQAEQAASKGEIVHFREVI